MTKHQRAVPLATVKAKFSQYVDDAERRGKRTLITRHGKPVAMLVPVEESAKRKTMTPEEAKAFLDRFTDLGDPAFPCVQDLIDGRR